MHQQAHGSSTESRLYADVIVPRHITRAFTYLVPPRLQQTLKVGQAVLVPFGRAMLEAAVISLNAQPPPGVDVHRLKEIEALTHDRSETHASSSTMLFELSRLVADYYVAPWGQCLRLIAPSRSARAGTVLRYVATDEGRAALKAGHCPPHLLGLLKRIARRSAGVSSATLDVTKLDDGPQGILDLEAQSWIMRLPSKPEDPDNTEVAKRRLEDVTQAPIDQASMPALRDADLLLVERITAGMHDHHYRRLVVEAPWEIRLRLLAAAIESAEALGQSVIVISGEIAKAQWLRERLSVMTKVPIAGPSMSALDQPAQRNTPSVIVGTRSAVFAPLLRTGLIWVDQEDDPALKELKEPRYHAREVACMRGGIEQAVVVLASSHPSLEARTDASAEILRAGQTASRPPVALVDLRMVPRGSPFSHELITAMQEAVARRAGVLLFLNRKGYAGALVCRECGWVPRCSSCAVAFPYSRETAALCCRYCGTREPLPETCPTCHASRLSAVGEGTERLEMEARRLFPGARIARFDGASLRRPAAARALWGQLRSSQLDIVIGTQALFQREPLPKMRVVGIVQADSGLHVADFRAAERTYHLLDDAVSVAQSASEGGRVILQTWFPEHHAVVSVASGDPGRFYDEELAARQLLDYPPARHLVSLSVSGRDRRLVGQAAQDWSMHLEQAKNGQGAIMMLGPVPAIAGRTRGLYRDHILLKGNDRTGLRQAVRDSVEHLEHKYRKGRLKFIVDVDPVDMF